jgi:hypothetical protein
MAFALSAIVIFFDLNASVLSSCSSQGKTFMVKLCHEVWLTDLQLPDEFIELLFSLASKPLIPKT